jgi:hypothetical protein
MELRRLITHFTYRIEPNPEGGFIARAADPTVAPLKAETREELRQKIQANIASALAAEFPGLKLPPENSKERQYAFHVEHKPEGGFVIHSADPDAKPIEGANHEEIENHFLEKLVGFAGKRFMPELSRVLDASGSGDIKVSVTTRTGLRVNAGTPGSNLGNDRFSSPAASLELQDAKLASAGSGTIDANFNNATEPISNSPITAETGGNWKLFSFLLTLLIIAAFMYFFFHHS